VNCARAGPAAETANAAAQAMIHASKARQRIGPLLVALSVLSTQAAI
jgi:hypothetical protein